MGRSPSSNILLRFPRAEAQRPASQLAAALLAVFALALALASTAAPAFAAETNGSSADAAVAARADEHVTTSDGLSYSYDDAVAMAEYDSDIWCNHADTSWYDGHEDEASYTLDSAEELAGLAVLVVKYGIPFKDKTIELSRDIDLEGHQWFPIGCNEATYWGQSSFAGTFEGNGHTIDNLYIENGYHGQALFGSVRDATLRNFTVRGSVTTGWQAAGVVAEASRTTLSNITSYVNVETLFKSGDGGYASTAGGIAAYVVDTYVDRSGAKPSRLENLVNYGSVEIAGITEQGGGVGGIAGSLVEADDDQTIVVSQCENHGSVHASSSNYNDIYIKGSGGIVGSTATYGNYQITDCSNTGAVSSDNLASTGGIVGAVSGLSSSVEYCYNAGDVNGASPEEVAAAGGIVGRSVAAHTGNTVLDVTSCYNVGSVAGRGANVSAILGSTSGYAEDWDSNDGGTTVNNDSNYYIEGSVKETSQTGVLFQSGTVETGQPVSRERMNSEEVVRNLNSTDAANDHYALGDTSPILELSGATDRGTGNTSTEGAGADQAVLGQEDNATQKETHLYAIKADSATDRAVAFEPDLIALLLGGAILALVVVGLALQGFDYRAQTRPLRAVEDIRKG